MSPPPDHTQSRILVDRARSRDGEAISELYELYKDRLRLALSRRLGPAYRGALLDSEDAVHDAILAALHSIEQFEYRGRGSFLAWLLVVAERQIVDKVRAIGAVKRGGSANAVSLEGIAASDATPSQVAEGQEAEVRLRRCLDSMAPHERDVVMLRRYLGLSFEEISVELQMTSVGATRALLSRAQARLAVMLESA